MKVGQGARISIELTIRLDEQVVGTTSGGEPLDFVVGAGEIFPALEQAMDGMAAGDSKQVELTAAEAYGPFDEESIQSIEASMVPEEARFVGAQLQGPDGVRARVVEVGDDALTVDFNHPLAGKDLSFEVKVLNVQPGEPAEE